jgi:choline dehydrogenase-like flavoprotein
MIHSLDGDVKAFSHYDVCIIGSGPAGITVCAELMESGCRICVLESGTETNTEFADSLRKVESHGVRVQPESRERILGGTSHTWAGVCVPLDPVDFASRAWLHHSGWPITWNELAPYLRSAERYGFPRLDLFADDGPFVDTAAAEPGWRSCEEKLFLLPANIPRFGLKYKHLFLKQDVDLILGATVVDLPADGSRGKMRVTAALCRSERNRNVLITADRFVLAAGAIDNARILLNSKSVVPEGLGNEQDQVGRYLMNHPRNIRLIRVRKWPRWLERYARRPYEGGIGYVGIRLRESEQLKEGVLNSCTRLLPFYPWTFSPVISAWRESVWRARAWFGHERSSIGRSRLTGNDWVHEDTLSIIAAHPNKDPSGARIETAWQALLSIPELLRLVVLRLVHRVSPSVPMIGLVNYVEMEPRPENRITLTHDRDALDMPVPRVVHEMSQRDLASLQCLHEQIATDLKTMGYEAEVVGTPEELAKVEWRDTYHYLGTTRMGIDPEQSVVNPDLKVHTVGNLYVAGGSVFPTSGCANPTMTIVALSIRLADHLRTAKLSD